jgi:hypothetical protein
MPEAFRGGWIINPANIVHMVRKPDAWRRPELSSAATLASSNTLGRGIQR